MAEKTLENGEIATMCYGELTFWDNRKEALDYYEEECYCSDGSEHERYLNIIESLLAGDALCFDYLAPKSTVTDEHPLWSAVCNGNNEAIVNYYNNGGSVNVRFSALGANHSLIMGALRNGYYETAKLLSRYNETIEPHECEEYAMLKSKQRGHGKEKTPIDLSDR